MYSQNKLPQRKKKSCKNTLLDIYTSSQINSKNALFKEMNWGLNGAKQISPWQC